VHELYLARLLLPVAGSSILAGGQLEVPILKELLLRFLRNPLAFVGFNLQLTVAADVAEMRRDGTRRRTTAR
jgi:hypothetical protein